MRGDGTGPELYERHVASCPRCGETAVIYTGPDGDSAECTGYCQLTAREQQELIDQEWAWEEFTASEPDDWREVL
jgi:hypothetical protein